jgi:acyl carrier protein phosphodiesterase
MDMWNVWEYTGHSNIIISNKSTRMIRIVDVISDKLNVVRESICEHDECKRHINPLALEMDI